MCNNRLLLHLGLNNIPDDTCGRSQIYINFIDCLCVMFLLYGIYFVSYFILTALRHAIVTCCFITSYYILYSCYACSVLDIL